MGQARAATAPCDAASLPSCTRSGPPSASSGGRHTLPPPNSRHTHHQALRLLLQRAAQCLFHGPPRLCPPAHLPAQISDTFFISNSGMTYGGAIAAADRRSATSSYLTTPNIVLTNTTFVNNSAMVRSRGGRACVCTRAHARTRVSVACVCGGGRRRSFGAACWQRGITHVPKRPSLRGLPVVFGLHQLLVGLAIPPPYSTAPLGPAPSLMRCAHKVRVGHMSTLR